jgi:hypothetical protein
VLAPRKEVPGSLFLTYLIWIWIWISEKINVIYKHELDKLKLNIILNDKSSGKSNVLRDSSIIACRAWSEVHGAGLVVCVECPITENYSPASRMLYYYSTIFVLAGFFFIFKKKNYLTIFSHQFYRKVLYCVYTNLVLINNLWSSTYSRLFHTTKQNLKRE